MAMSTLPLSPTSNTMDPDERRRLVRTARKLEVLLGATPQVVVEMPEEEQSTFLRDFLERYRGSPFSSSSSLRSASSLASSTLSEKEDHDGRLIPVHSQPSSPWNDRLLSATVERKTRETKGPKPLAPPLLLRMSAVPVANHSRHPSKSTKSSKPSKSATAGAATALPPVRPKPKLVPPSLHVTPAPPLLTPSERRKLKVDSVLGPLSPINKAHHHHSKSHLDRSASPLSPLPEPDAPVGLSDREKRIKMAKLQRMMGEFIPPELVFGDATSPSAQKTEKKLIRRTRSMTSKTPRSGRVVYPIPEEPRETKGKTKENSAQPLRTHASSHSLSSPPPPSYPSPSPSYPSPSPSYPSPSPSFPSPIITRTSTTITESPLFRKPSLSMQQRKRKARPRSLSLGNNSAVAAANIKLAEKKEKKEEQPVAPTRGTVSLDEGRQDEKKKSSNGSGKVNNKTLESSYMPFSQSPENEKTPNFANFKADLWRRKEREWSGEWNVKDMNHVAKALRSLKAT